MAIIVYDNDLKKDVKLKCQEKYVNQMNALLKNNVKCKSCIICLFHNHIEPELEALKVYFPAHDPRNCSEKDIIFKIKYIRKQLSH